jgi:hypothetical protein
MSDEIFENEKIADIDIKKIGINILETFNVRSEELTDNTINCVYKDYISIYITDELAKKSSLFQDTNKIYVYAPKKFLNEFYEIKFDEESKKIINVLNESRLIEFWISSGFKTCFIEESKIEERKIEIEKLQKEREEKEIKRQEEIKRIKEIKQKYLGEKEKWIINNGSEYLKDCLNLGYSANKEYVIERATIDFANYIVDYDDDAKWETRVSPSQTALDEIKRIKKDFPELKAEIVWLIKPSYEIDYDDYENYPREAIVICNYLGEYTLIAEAI